MGPSAGVPVPRAPAQGAEDYKPQIDGLRAFAVMPVLYYHFWDPDTWLGSYGIQLFFVISGYLITRILLRGAAEPGGVPPRRFIVRFYIRRALRIWPAYFACLAIVLLAADGGANAAVMRESAPWHALFLSNIWFVRQNDWAPWFTSHLWSLSVEEQFYLFWPLVVFAARRQLPAILAIGIALGGALQIWQAAYRPDSPMLVLLLPFSLDALGLGALLAWLEAQPRRWRISETRLKVVIAAWLVWILLLPVLDLPKIVTSTLHVLTLMPVAAVVLGASQGFTGLTGRVLEHAAVRWLGRISYGVYLYHLFVVAAWGEAARRLSLPLPPDIGPALFVIGSAMTIIVAAMSWWLFEGPINRLKTRFPYTTRA